jgi:hypothetical protein
MPVSKKHRTKKNNYFGIRKAAREKKKFEEARLNRRSRVSDEYDYGLTDALSSMLIFNQLARRVGKRNVDNKL